MTETDQIRPLAPAIDSQSSEEVRRVSTRKRTLIKCCGCISALLLILAIVIIILIFTIFRVQDPDIKLNGFTITKLELINGTRIPKPGVNMSLIADVSVKNPNIASFKYGNTTTKLYYHGTVVGEVRGPGGETKARRTVRMNITVDVMTDRILSDPNLASDAGSGVLGLESYSRIGGRVNVLNVYKSRDGAKGGLAGAMAPQLLKNQLYMYYCTIVFKLISGLVVNTLISNRKGMGSNLTQP